MTPRQQIIAVVGALLLLALIIELVRRQKIRTGYSLLWLFVGFVTLVLVLLPGVVGFLAHLMGIQSSRSLLFTAGILFALLLLLDHSLTLTILWRQDKSLAQDHALLELRVRQLEARMPENDSARPAVPESEALPEGAVEHAGEETNDAKHST